MCWHKKNTQYGSNAALDLFKIFKRYGSQLIMFNTFESLHIELAIVRSAASRINSTVARGGDLGRMGGRSLQKCEMGGRPMHPSPPIFREVVLSEARESTNRVKKGVVKEFFSEIVIFLLKKGS